MYTLNKKIEYILAYISANSIRHSANTATESTF